jgi:XisH protein
LKVGGVDMEIDLGAERIIGAERQGQKIAVEIKSFLAGSSAISEFHRALGQFINYRIALRSEEPNRILYLAVPAVAFNTFFQLDFTKSVVEENQLNLLAYDTLSQSDLLWIPEIILK